MDISQAQGLLPTPEGDAAAIPAPPPASAAITGHAPQEPDIAHLSATREDAGAKDAKTDAIANQADAQSIAALPKDAPASPGLTAFGVPRGEHIQSATPDLGTPSTASPSVPSGVQRGGRSGRGAHTSWPTAEDGSIMTDSTPGSAPRGRPIGRPRGSRARGTTRGGARGGRGGKRKRTKDDEDDGDDTSDSEIITPSANITKSGRNVQKPTSFVPPPMPSPTAQPSYKKRKPQRRNFESAVCKVCLRGVSPASNMIVFCDACSTAYHRYCHHPPIDQSVIDEVDKEWYCRPCERERIEPVPEEEVIAFIPGAGASAEEVRLRLADRPDVAADSMSPEAEILLNVTSRATSHTTHTSDYPASKFAGLRSHLSAKRSCTSHEHTANKERAYLFDQAVSCSRNDFERHAEREAYLHRANDHHPRHGRLRWLWLGRAP